MSFGLLKHFKDRKKSDTEKTITHYEHLIIGQDLGAVLKLFELRHSHPDAKIRMISARPLTKKALLENYELGVSLIRSPQAVEGIYRKYHNAKILPHAKEASFYKDGKFHDFGGRAKPMELLAGEEFFTQKGFDFEVQSLFSEEDWEQLDEVLRLSQEIRILESIEKTTPTDLVDKTEWSLMFKDFTKVGTENLYVSMSSKKFLSVLANKESLSHELIDVCSSVLVQSAITVTWTLNKEIHSSEQTLFIPQSMTHEWGHFIVEFDSYDYEKNHQLMHVLFLIHEEDPQTEDMASKIKLIKRVMERVFPDLEKSMTNEFIRFDDEMFISGVKDELLEQVSFDYPNLKFLGQQAAMAPEHTSELFLSRTLLS